MSLAATLASEGMRPASFLPTIKCSNCGDDIEISSMGEHECSPVADSPKAAPASMSNPFTIRQLNAMENKPAQPSPLQYSGSETRPAQPSPLQFNGHETRPMQPSPLQFDSTSAPPPRPRAPTTGSSSLPLPKASRPALPRINPDAANQPFLGPLPNTPLSPASSVRSASSSSSRNTQPKRSMTTPMPRIFDPRPPSPELSANLDCAFPPFPTPTIAKRKASSASQSSSRSGPRQDVYELQPKSPLPGLPRQDVYELQPNSPLPGAGDSMMSKMNPARNASLESGSRRPSNEHLPPLSRETSGTRPSPQSTSLSPLAEFPAEPYQHHQEPMSSSTPVQISAPVLTNAPISRSETPTSSHRESGFSNMMRRLSRKGRPPERPARPDEPLPLPTSLAPGVPNPFQQPAPFQQPDQRRIPPARPVRPEEGLPPALLNPMHLQSFGPTSPGAPRPPPFPLHDTDRSLTQPLPAREGDGWGAPLSKMSSEPALRLDVGFNNNPELTDHVDDDGHSIDQRIQGGPMPKSVQMHRIESLHKSSESGTSTASSILSLGEFSTRNDDTTAGTSPVVSAASSLDAFSPLTAGPEKDAEDEEEDRLRVDGLTVKGSRDSEHHSDVEAFKRHSFLRMAPSPLAAEILHPDEDASDDDISPPSMPISPQMGSWPLESPMDPELHNGKLGELQDDVSPAQTPIEPPQRDLLTPEAPKLERLSNAVYDPKRPFVAQPDSKQEQEQQHATQNRDRSQTKGESEFEGFNFGNAFALKLVQSDSEASSRKPSESAASTVSDACPSDAPTTTSQTPEAPPPIPASVPAAPAAVRPALLRRGTTGIKTPCRGCYKQIEGKSVKAADGRLTGRWHKACFVCATCKHPFETADFYVIDNHPYCEQHYHEKNGSLCHGCQKGIEGQFLETVSGHTVRKYHRRCFTCVDCRMVLSEDYFEIAGRIHCERHALAAMRSQGRRPSHPGATLLPRGSSNLRAENFQQPERQRAPLHGHTPLRPVREVA